MVEKRELKDSILFDEGDSNLTSSRQKWHDEELDAETRKWLKKDETVFLHQSLSTPCLDLMETCEGSYITDHMGNRFLDFHGNSVHQVGFANPEVITAIKAQLDELSFCTRRFTNKTSISLAEKLVNLASPSLNKVLFAPGGTTAVGIAIKLARLVTGRFKTLSMWDSFHGASLDALSVGGEAFFREGIGPLLPGSEHVPPPDPYRCLWREDSDCSQCDLKCAKYIEYVLDKERDVAALIAEPIRCTKINPPPEGFWDHVRDVCNRHGTLLIFDETAVCLGKTGEMFACQTYNVEPDILTIGKGLGGGILPLAAVLSKEDMDVASHTALGHYTHEKNPVLCAAGLATLDYIESENLLDRVKKLEPCIAEKLNRLKQRHALVGDVRGQGLIFGAELVTDRIEKKPAIEAADQVMYECLKRGLSFKTSQGNFITLTPPLTVTNQELDDAFEILDRSLAAVSSS